MNNLLLLVTNYPSNKIQSLKVGHYPQGISRMQGHVAVTKSQAVHMSDVPRPLSHNMSL